MPSFTLAYAATVTVTVTVHAPDEASARSRAAEKAAGVFTSISRARKCLSVGEIEFSYDATEPTTIAPGVESPA